MLTNKIRMVQLIFILICTLIIYHINAPHVFLIISIISLIICCLNYLKRNTFDYLPALLLIFSILGFYIDFFTSVICFIFGMATFSFNVNVEDKIEINWDNFTVSTLSTLGFWIIYYKFIKLGNIAILLAINASFLIFLLSLVLIEEEMGDNTH